MLNQTTSTTAVLLFNFSEKQKASLKEIAPRISERKLGEVINLLNSRAKGIAKRSHLPFFQVNASSHVSFGEQLHEAYQALFKQGFDAVIGISNDCPTLNEKDLTKAAEALKSGQAVFGPATDGGLYLLGLSKGTINQADFERLNWQTESLMTSFFSLSDQLGLRFALLDEKADMDTVGEFQKAFKSNIHFINRLKSVLLSFNYQRLWKETSYSYCDFSSLFFLRGPPIIV